MTTGERIKEARKRAGMTQKELADKLGISIVGVSKWENGIRNPKKETLRRIAKALGVPFSSIDPPFNYWTDENGVEHIEEMSLIGKAIDVAFRATYPDIPENPTLSVLLESGYSFSESEQALIKSFSSLNEPGQQKAVERVEELTEIPKYQRSGSPAASQPSGRDTTTPAPETPSERKETPPQANAQDGEGE